MSDGKRGATAVFLALTFLLSWPLWYASGILGRRGVGAYDHVWLIAQVGVLGPSLAALLVSATRGPVLRRNALRILPMLILPLVVPGLLVVAQAPAHNTELTRLPAVLTVVVAVLVILFFSPLHRALRLPGTGQPPGRPTPESLWLSLLLFPALFLVAWGMVRTSGTAGEATVAPTLRTIAVAWSFNLMLGGSLGEEVGWRGFLLPRLLEKHSPLGASLLLGLAWALWHLPIDLASGFAVQGPPAIVARIFWTLPVTVIFTWLYLKARGSLLVALFLHTSLNVLSDLGFASLGRALIVLSLINLVVAVGIVVRSRWADVASGRIDLT